MMPHPSEKHAHFDHLPRPLVVMENRWPRGTSTGWHTHPTGQLLYATEGVMLVNTDAGSWVVTPNRALWMLPRLRHNVTMSGDVLIRTAYIDVSKVPTLPVESGVVNVSPLLRKLPGTRPTSTKWQAECTQASTCHSSEWKNENVPSIRTSTSDSKRTSNVRS